MTETEAAPAVRAQTDTAQTYLDRKAGAIATIAAASDVALSKSDRTALAAVVRQRARIAKEDVGARQAAILARGEAALSSRFDEQDSAWADLAADARTHMAEIKAKLSDRAEQLGIPATFRPTYELWWIDRGENASASRRGELRLALRAQAEAAARAAKLEIERWSADLQTAILAGGLASDAKDILGQLPSAEALMPELDLPALGQ